MNANIEEQIAYTFEVGGTYHHQVGNERKYSTFICTAREGDVIILEEQGGKGRTFTGQVSRAETWGGYNECLRIGIIPRKGYNLVDSIPAHDFLLEGSE